MSNIMPFCDHEKYVEIMYGNKEAAIPTHRTSSSLRHTHLSSFTSIWVRTFGNSVRIGNNLPRAATDADNYFSKISRKFCPI